MSDPQPGHVRPYSIPRQLSSGSDISGPQADFQRGWPDMSNSQPGHVWVSDTPMVRFSWGAIKGPHTSLARLATHFILKHFDTLSSAPNLSPLSFSSALSLSSYPLIFLFEGVAPKIS
jgi:hypothetical protein